MFQLLASELACISLFFVMIVVSSLCYPLGLRKRMGEDSASDVSGAIIGALFALLGLLIAFTFSGAYSRLEARRALIVDEANAIGTAYLRVDLMPLSAQPPMRELFRDYATSRANLYSKLANKMAAVDEQNHAISLQNRIWTQAVTATQDPQYHSTRMLLLPALNQMIDIVTTRSIAIVTHPPLLIWCTLFAIAVVCAGMTGYRSGIAGRPAYFYQVLLAAMIASVLYVTLDMEYPSSGLIRLDWVNQALLDQAASMQQ